MDSVIRNALKKKRNLESELKKINQFLEAYEEFSGTKIVQDEMVSPPDKLGGNKDIHRKEPRIVKKRNDTTRIANVARKVIHAAGRPLSRGELVEMIENEGLAIHSDDKARYIGTILWRNRDKFENIKGEGYWVKGLGKPGNDLLNGEM